MSVLRDKYRGSMKYTQVRDELIRAAENQDVTTYQKIAAIMGLPSQGQHMAKETGYMLGEISEDESNDGRPMLSAVAVGVSGKPGRGFIAMAKALGKFNGSSSEEDAFWRQECQAVYDAWKRPVQSEALSQPFTIKVKVEVEAVVTPETVGGFSVTVPALPGCFTEGETLEEVQDNVVEAAEAWLEVKHKIETRRTAEAERQAS